MSKKYVFLEMLQALDSLDRRILSLLDANARQSTSKIARTVRHGRDTVEYRIGRLQDRGIINKFSAVVDPSTYGFSIYKLYLKLRAEERARSALLSDLFRQPRVYWIAECDGCWDLLFSIVAYDLKEFHELQSEILSKHSNGVIEFSVYPLVEAHFFKKKYLHNSDDDSFLRIGGRVTKRNMDKNDVKILALLSDNARMPISQIAQRVKLSSDMVRYRIQRLEHDEVIKGYRSELNLSKLYMVFFKAQIFLYKQDQSIAKSILAYCAKHSHITYVITQVGYCQLEIELEVQDYYHYNSIIHELRHEYSKSIRNVESTLVRTDKYKWISPVT